MYEIIMVQFIDSTSDYDGTIFAGFCIAFHSTCITSSHNLSIKFGLAKISDCEQYFNTQWLKTRSHNQQNFSADKNITRGKTNYKQAYLHHTEFQDVSSGLQIFLTTQDIYHLIQVTENQLSFPSHLQNISITSIYQLICASRHRLSFHQNLSLQPNGTGQNLAS